MHPRNVSPTLQQLNIERARSFWLQLELWSPDPAAIVMVAPKSDTVSLLTRCPLCCAAMPADAHECPNCGVEIDL